MRERGDGRRRAGLQKAASGDCHKSGLPVAIWLRCGFYVDIAAYSVCQTPLNCQYVGPEGSKIEYCLGPSSLTLLHPRLSVKRHSAGIFSETSRWRRLSTTPYISPVVFIEA